jgi:hypothetical protein
MIYVISLLVFCSQLSLFADCEDQVLVTISNCQYIILSVDWTQKAVPTCLSTTTKESIPRRSIQKAFDLSALSDTDHTTPYFYYSHYWLSVRNCQQPFLVPLFLKLSLLCSWGMQKRHNVEILQWCLVHQRKAKSECLRYYHHINQTSLLILRLSLFHDNPTPPRNLYVSTVLENRSLHSKAVATPTVTISREE